MEETEGSVGARLGGGTFSITFFLARIIGSPQVDFPGEERVGLLFEVSARHNGADE